MNYNETKLSIMKEYKDLGEVVDVYFHSTYQKDLHEGNFNYKLDTKGTGTIGMFAHLGNDDYFEAYGDKVIAVVVNRSKDVIVRPVDDTDHNDNIEVFIDKTTVEEMIELWLI